MDKLNKSVRQSALNNSSNLARQESILINDSCSICMGDFEVQEEILNTQCKHSYHEACIDKWID